MSAEDGGRHAKWLNQMAPTFRIIRDLMASHGVLFVHINDIELPRLLLLLEEIFDERNHIGTIVWRASTENNPTRISIEHEYIVCFAKDIGSVPKVWKSPAAETRDLMLEEFGRLQAAHPQDELPAIERRWKRFISQHKAELEQFAHYNRVDEHGPYTGMRALHKPEKGGYFYDILHPTTGRAVKTPLRGYRFPKHRMQELIDSGRIIFGPDETQLLQLKVYLREADVSLKGIIDLDNRSAAAELARLLPNQPDAFRNPKPTALEEYILSFVTDRQAIVLDCFAGSGTTGHAVMRMNGRDGGSRRFILIEEGEGDDRYAETLIVPRLRAARLTEQLPGGFTFKRVGPRIDFESLERLQRSHLIETVLQTDATGRGGGIRRVEGPRWVIGRNARNEAICLHFDPKEHSAVSAEILREMYLEAKELGLAKPIRVYGEACEVFGSESFRFLKLPDEVANNLVVSLRPRR